MIKYNYRQARIIKIICDIVIDNEKEDSMKIDIKIFSKIDIKIL